MRTSSKRPNPFFQPIQSNVMGANILSYSVVEKIFIACLVFGCCFALVVYLFWRWQRRSGQMSFRHQSYSEKLTDRFNRAKKIRKSNESSRKAKIPLKDSRTSKR
jgi:hypothetical protein